MMEQRRVQSDQTHSMCEQRNNFLFEGKTYEKVVKKQYLENKIATPFLMSLALFIVIVDSCSAVGTIRNRRYYMHKRYVGYKIRCNIKYNICNNIGYTIMNDIYSTDTVSDLKQLNSLVLAACWQTQTYAWKVGIHPHYNQLGFLLIQDTLSLCQRPTAHSGSCNNSVYVFTNFSLTLNMVSFPRRSSPSHF